MNSRVVFSKAALQAVRFVLVGAFCAAFDFLLYALMVEFLGVYYVFATVFSTVIAIVLNYFLTRKWVFSSSKYSFKYEFSSFVLFSLVGLLLNLGLILLFVEKIQMNPLLGKLLAIGLVSVFNYFSKKKLVFGE
ncbi:GtrA family protein [Rufibacter glacialis]|uniref:GtrA family protein n=1 Tax=Rufibacter glacialis TaxID=1259555 RepID=A0A5M8QNU3_9BACT|nr:GtrA family protein [Rufibacter glacialis]